MVSSFRLDEVSSVIQTTHRPTFQRSDAGLLQPFRDIRHPDYVPSSSSELLRPV